MTKEEKVEYCESRLHCDEGDCKYCLGEYDELGNLILFCGCDFDTDDEED